MGRKGGMEGRRRETVPGVGGGGESRLHTDTNQSVLPNLPGPPSNFVSDWPV